MKFLVASVSSTLNSLVAKHFEHAAWFLIVDDETRTFDAAQNVTPNDHHSILVRASSDEVDVVLGGKFSAGSLKHIQSRDLSVAHVYGITVTQAIEKVTSGEIRTQSGFASLDVAERFIGMTPRVVTMRGKQKKVLGTSYASDSLRGHHHLQQYGGRGH